MTDRWLLPKPEIRLTGTVTYRCHQCGELIEDGTVVFSGAGKQTSTYHPEHLPVLLEQQEDHPDGR